MLRLSEFPLLRRAKRGCMEENYKTCRAFFKTINYGRRSTKKILILAFGDQNNSFKVSF